MSEKKVIVTLEDGFGRVQTSIATSLSAPQLMDKIMQINRLETELKCYKGIIEALERTRVIEVEIPTDKVRDRK